MNELRQVPIGVFSRIVSRRHFTQAEYAKPPQWQVYSALVRRLVRTIGTYSPMRTGHKFALLVRTLLREARANLAGAYQQWLPDWTVTRREVSTVVSTALQWFSLVERRFSKQPHGWDANDVEGIIAKNQLHEW